MIKCLIIDDEDNCRIALRELLKTNAPDFQLIYHTDDANQAYSLITDGTFEPDVVFLDIQMPKCDGFSFLKKFESLPFHVIFTTAYDQYAIKAIRFSAIDYLLKPVDIDDLVPALEKCRNAKQLKIQSSVSQFKNALSNGNLFEKLAIHSSTEITFISTLDILFFESSNNYTTVHLNDGTKIVSSKNIGYYEELLEGLPFFRVHNSYIINLKKIKKYMRGKTGLIELDNGEQIAVSNRRKDELVKILNIS